MGTITSKDSRRISFENNFSVRPVLLKKTNDNYVENNLKNENLFNHSELKLSTKSIDECEDYWADRIDYLKNEHHVINKIIEEEYENTIEHTNKLFEPPKITAEKINKLKPCFEWQTKILKCYEENPRQTLACSGIVEAFKNYVSLCQQE